MKDKDIRLTPEIAKALLEYIAMEESKEKNIVTVLAKSEIEQYLGYVDAFANSLNISQEDALQRLIERGS